MGEPEYEWDQNKNLLNQRKHGVAFELAIEVFDDPFQLPEQDADYFNEWRWRTIGRASTMTVLFVVHTLWTSENGIEITRIISARPATKHEKRRYERARRTYR